MFIHRCHQAYDEQMSSNESKCLQVTVRPFFEFLFHWAYKYSQTKQHSNSCVTSSNHLRSQLPDFDHFNYLNQQN